ncbi:Terpenoid synthase [Pyrenophora seminiperda CCB06]|uniref:geranylgeranyl diphosphate synthase n=1 Tax=Pyrenophora seminiperda CCB06 TaxID=1302712 RepID=A0A3M7MEI8_9PLEO|nr:Terpenoid synthase [Pyrenophora seminiperda CCB06]
MAQNQCEFGQRLSVQPDQCGDHFETRHLTIDKCVNDERNYLADCISETKWNAVEEEILMGPFDYLEAQPGKDIRSQFMHALNAWLQVPARSLSVIMRAVSMLHTSSLLIDDIQDNSQLRRGAPVAHEVFGTAQTINSANYVYFCALQKLSTLENPALIQVYTEELLNLHRGQGMDIFWRDTSTCPTELEYIRMVGNKTGGLFRLATRLMCAESRPVQHDAKYVRLVNSIGVLFQVLDDYRNLTDTLYAQNKGYCEDLTEGKFSFPVIHAIQSENGGSYLLDILRLKTNDDKIKRDAAAFIEQRGSLLYTQVVLQALKADIVRQIDELDAGKGKSGALKAILEKLIGKEKC